MEDGDGEGTSLSGTGLGLSDSISTLEDWEDTLGLNDGWLDETVTVDTSEEVWLKVELIEGFNGFFPVGFDFSLFFLFHAV